MLVFARAKDAKMTIGAVYSPIKEVGDIFFAVIIAGVYGSTSIGCKVWVGGVLGDKGNPLLVCVNDKRIVSRFHIFRKPDSIENDVE